MHAELGTVSVERAVLAFLQLLSGMRGASLDPDVVVRYFGALGLPVNREDHVLDVAGVRIGEKLEKEQWMVSKLDLAAGFYRHFFGESEDVAHVYAARSHSEAMRIWVELFQRKVSKRA